jgi:hypothetical protein
MQQIRSFSEFCRQICYSCKTMSAPLKIAHFLTWKRSLALLYPSPSCRTNQRAGDAFPEGSFEASDADFPLPHDS